MITTLDKSMPFAHDLKQISLKGKYKKKTKKSQHLSHLYNIISLLLMSTAYKSKSLQSAQLYLFRKWKLNKSQKSNPEFQTCYMKNLLCLSHNQPALRKQYAAILCQSQASFCFSTCTSVYEMSMQTNSMFCNAISKLKLYIPTLKVKA